MVRYTGPKNRIARKFGVNLFGRSRNPLQHKAHPPGMHGSKRKKKSDYGIQLEEQQKLKAAYGMLTQRQLVFLYQEVARHHKNTPELFLQRLECRLDTIVYKLKFAGTIFGAQQLVAHGHILVDGRPVDRRCFFVKPGMVISVKEASKKMKTIQDATQNTTRSVPAYLSLGSDNCSGKLLSLPGIDEIALPLEVNVPMVCDFLAHGG